MSHTATSGARAFRWSATILSWRYAIPRDRCNVAQAGITLDEKDGGLCVPKKREADGAEPPRRYKRQRSAKPQVPGDGASGPSIVAPVIAPVVGQHNVKAEDKRRGSSLRLEVPQLHRPSTVDVRQHEVDRPVHPVTGTKVMWLLHDRLHGVAHQNCDHRDPQHCVQLDGVNTEAAEHLNRGRSCYVFKVI